MSSTSSGSPSVAPEDPEPEFVDVNRLGEAVRDAAGEQPHRHRRPSPPARSLKQLPGRRRVTWPASTRSATASSIRPASSTASKREPDAAAWLDDDRFVTANEGDYEGGSRGFTIFRKDGTVEFDSGAMLEHLAIRLGHYPERRSSAKGVEPEGVEAATLRQPSGCSSSPPSAPRWSFVFRDKGPGQAPEFLQALPAGAGPEGLVAIPRRNLLVVTSEADGGADGLARPHVMIYRRAEGDGRLSDDRFRRRKDGLPIAWGALSGLAADRATPGKLFAVTDSVYATSRILEIDATARPAQITGAITVTKDGKPAGFDIEGIAVRPAAASGWRRRAIPSARTAR